MDGAGHRRGPRHRVARGRTSGATGPFVFSLIAGGRSNLTFRVERRGRPRGRPAPAPGQPRAADRARHGARAHGDLGARPGRACRCPRPWPCASTSRSTSAPFYVMEFVDGRDPARRARRPRRATPEADRGRDRDEPRAGRWPGSTPSTSTTSGSATSPVTTATSSASSGAGAPSTSRCTRRRRGGAGAGRGRSPNAWPPTIPWPAARLDRARRLPPRQHRARRRRPVRAILDWEICTLGDPLADVGLFCDYWAEPEDPTAPLIGAAPTTAAGFETRDAGPRRVRARERPRTGRGGLLAARSATGSWPASSRASTRVTARARPPATRAASPSSRATSSCSPRWRSRQLEN